MTIPALRIENLSPLQKDIIKVALENYKIIAAETASWCRENDRPDLKHLGILRMWSARLEATRDLIANMEDGIN